MTSESQPLLSRPEEKKRIFALPDLPWGQFAIIWLMRLSEPVALISIFPWINDAVGRDPTLHITPAQVGLYSGFIESAFSLGQIFTSYVWSAKSDVYGRKPIFLASLLGITIFSFGMGFARTFRSMVLLRFLTGCFCGATGPVKVVLLELSTKKTEAAIFSLIPLSWTVGSMLGSMIGGYFARPAEHFPVFKDSVFLKAYPYFLSSAVSSLFPLAGFLVVLFGFKETKSREGKSTVADEEEAPAVVVKPSIRSLLTPQLVAILVNTALATVLLMTVNTLVPLFSYTPIKDGGLALSPRQIGLALTWLSVFRTVCQIFLFPVLHRKLGSTGVLRLAVSTYPLIAIFLPLSNVLARAHKPLAAIMVYMLAVSVPGISNMIFSVSNLLVSAATPTQGSLGTVFGITQTVAAVARMLGPIVANPLFALSAAHALGGYLVWIFFLVVALITCGTSWAIREQKTAWRNGKD